MEHNCDPGQVYRGTGLGFEGVGYPAGLHSIQNWQTSGGNRHLIGRRHHGRRKHGCRCHENLLVGRKAVVAKGVHKGGQRAAAAGASRP